MKIASVPSGTLNNFYPGKNQPDKHTNKQTHTQTHKLLEEISLGTFVFSLDTPTGWKETEKVSKCGEIM